MSRSAGVNSRSDLLSRLVSESRAEVEARRAAMPAHHLERSLLPSHGAILKSIRLPDLDVAEHERARAERYARGEGLY